MYVKDAENTAVCSMNVQDTDNTDQMVPSMVDINIEYNFVDDMESGSPTAIESDRYLKNSVWKSIVHVIIHASFQENIISTTNYLKK